MIQTKNFNPVDDPKLKCTCGHLECDERSVNQRVLDRIQLIRDDLQAPMVITSGGRCPNHPSEVRRTKPADHQNQVAVDVLCKSVTMRNKLMVLAGRHGAKSVAAGSNFVHIGFRDTPLDKVVSWEYS